MEGDLVWGGEQIVQYTNDVLQIYTPETCVVILTNSISTNSI